MATWRLKCVSKFSEQENLDVFKICWPLWDINARRILSLNVLMSTKGLFWFSSHFQHTVWRSAVINKL
jgi:hypothetical protein